MATPPPTKKAKQLVQARLPFAILDKSNSASSKSCQKKRKLSDNSSHAVTQKGPKLPKNDENVVVIDDDSNEKAENTQDVKEEKVNDKVGNNVIMDKFVVKLPSKTEDISEETSLTNCRKVNENTPEKKCPDQSSSSDSTPSEIVSVSSSTVSTPMQQEISKVSNTSSPTTPVGKATSSNEKSDSETSPSVTRKVRKTPDPAKKAKEIEEKKRKEKEREEKDRLKREMKEKKERERKLEKERKDKERQAEKDKKEKEKQELKQKKEQERIEKEKEKEMKRKQVEDEKRKKLEQKEEDKKKKQELMDAKNAEKKQKDDEKKKLEEDKRKQEEEKNKIQEKQKAVFTNFFHKTSPKAAIDKIVDRDDKPGMFFAFEKKKDMHLAPCIRASIDSSQIQHLDNCIDDQQTKVLYIDELRSGKKTGKSFKTYPQNDDLEIIEASSSLATRMKTKLLQFRENYRPAYYGTWRKTSSTIKPVRPFALDKTHLDYEVESDDEWEEEEPGESLSNSEGEDEDEKPVEGDPEGDDEMDDGFFVPHGYLSEGEGCDEDEEDNTPERLKARQQARARAFEAEMQRMQKCEILKPRCIGCCWFNPNEDEEESPEVKLLLQFKAVPLVSSLPICLEVQASAAVEEKVASTTKEKEKEKKGPKLMAVPDEAIPELIRLVHGNSFSIQKLVKEFREYWHRKSLGELIGENGDETETPISSVPGTPGSNTPVPMETGACDTPDRPKSSSPKAESGGTPNEKNYTVSKRQLDAKIREIAAYEKREGYKRICWYVSSQLLEKHGLTDLPVPTQWKWITRVEKPKKTKPELSSAGQTPNGRNTPPPSVGRHTPTASSIKQFTVPNLSPLLFTPVSSKVSATPGADKTEVLKPTPVKADSPAAADGSEPKPREKSVLLKMFNSMASKTGDGSIPTVSDGKNQDGKAADATRYKDNTDKAKPADPPKESDIIVLD